MICIKIKSGEKSMIKIAICDDEKTMCEYLEQKVSEILKKWNIVFSIVCYTDALKCFQSGLSFDLMFLDIQMPHLNGIALAKKLRKQSSKCELIFVTILKEYVLYAFEVEAADYIYKPIELHRLEKALKRVIKRLENQYKKCIFVQTKNYCKTIYLEEIYYIEVINRKIYVYTQNGIIEYYGKLQEVQYQLDERFIKCHRSYIINIDYLSHYENGMIQMKNGSTVPVSRLRQKELIDTVFQYIKGRE